MKYVIIIIFFSLLLISCHESVSPPPTNQPIYFSRADTVEAGECAVFLSGIIKPSDSLITDLLYKFFYLRSYFGDTTKYRDTFDILKSRFLAPWIISAIMVKFDSMYIGIVNRGEYREWECFEEYLRPIYYDSVDNLGWTKLRFNKFLHPKRLSELYKNLSGVLVTEPISYTWIWEPPFVVFPRQTEEFFSVVYDIGSKCFYFKFENNIPKLIGIWDRTGPEPIWWNEAKLNIEFFWNSM